MHAYTLGCRSFASIGSEFRLKASCWQWKSSTSWTADTLIRPSLLTKRSQFATMFTFVRTGQSQREEFARIRQQTPTAGYNHSKKFHRSYFFYHLNFYLRIEHLGHCKVPTSWRLSWSMLQRFLRRIPWKSERLICSQRDR